MTTPGLLLTLTSSLISKVLNFVVKCGVCVRIDARQRLIKMLFHPVIELTGLAMKRREIANQDSSSLCFENAFGPEGLHDATSIATANS